jgi:hypothetical protein
MGGDVPLDSDIVTDFINLNIKSAQSFGYAYVGRMCIHISIRISAHTYINIYVYIVFLKKSKTATKKT